jgi:hypothetical protein
MKVSDLKPGCETDMLVAQSIGLVPVGEDSGSVHLTSLLGAEPRDGGPSAATFYRALSGRSVRVPPDGANPRLHGCFTPSRSYTGLEMAVGFCKAVRWGVILEDLPGEGAVPGVHKALVLTRDPPAKYAGSDQDLLPMAFCRALLSVPEEVLRKAREGLR